MRSAVVAGVVCAVFGAARADVDRRVAAWLAASAPRTDTTISNYWNDRWHMFYSEGDSVRGDACSTTGAVTNQKERPSAVIVPCRRPHPVVGHLALRASAD